MAVLKIGILGGTFDPIHKGHIGLAKKAIEVLELTDFYFVPNGNPPHKSDQTDKKDRYNMTADIARKNDFFVSDYEVKKEEYSYTYETLRHFKEKYPHAELYFIIGMDNLADIPKWKNIPEIFKNAKIAVFERQGYQKDQETVTVLKEKYNAEFTFFDFNFPVSSTEIREKLTKGENVLSLLDVDTLKYILRNGLYGLIPVKEFDFYENELKKFIEKKRENHSIGVAVTAYLLAVRYNEDVKLAYQTGLMHDIAKRLPIHEQLKFCEGIELHPDEKIYTKMLHSPAGSGVVKKKYNITDQKMLSAIRLHTIGSPEMSLFDKIIYMADYIEPYRDFEGVTSLRELTFKDINKGIIKGMNTTILSLLEENSKISPIMITVRNGLLEKEKEGN